MAFNFEYSFKRLTPDNWLELDEAVHLPEVLCDLDEYSRQEWMAPLFEPQLAAHIPKAVSTQFEVARGAFCYSYFFYPLFQVGLDKLFQAMEWALILRCEQMGFKRHETSWNQALCYLHQQGMLTASQKEEWEVLMLNRYLHDRHHQAYLSPSYAILGIASAANLINGLYQPQHMVA